MKLKPEILTHPHIPKPLHGLNPRTILGKDWWDITRQKAYKSTDYHCVACGVKKQEAKKFHWLEAHEYWNIDYTKGIAEVISIEPLCHYCHNFIHSGRLAMIINKDKSEEEVKDILEHGFKIISDNNLQCFPFTLDLAEDLNANTFNVKSYDNQISSVDWSEWKIILEGKEYKSKFKNYEEWKKYYIN